MDLQLLFASAVTPSLLLLWYFHSRDHHPEPRGVLLATFFLGVLIALPVILLAVPVDAYAATITDPNLRGVFRAFFVAAIPEEALKLAVVWGYCARHKAFDEPMDGLVYGAVASLGFATLENILYVVQGGLGLALLRALSAVPSHAFWGVIMGLYVGQAKFGPPERRRRRLLAAFFIPMILHGLYDAPLLALNQATELAAATTTDVPGPVLATLLVSLATLVISGTWAVRAAGDLRQAQLAAAGGGASLPAPVAATTAPDLRRSPFLGVVLLVIGGLLVCVGGFFLLGVLHGFTSGEFTRVEPPVLILAIVIAVLPLVLGLVVFRAGLRRL